MLWQMGLESAVDGELDTRAASTPRTASKPRAASIVRAYDEVAVVLETVDLANEPELADEVIAALAALDRAYAIASGPTDATV